MPGYDKARIEGVTEQELDEFTCGICLGLFDNPVATQCCRQTYCKDCIREWVALHKTCPNDRKTLTKKGLRPVPLVLVNLLDNMKIKCNYESDGCSQVVKIGELSQHNSVCDYRPNQLCKTCGLIKESVLTHNCIQELISENKKIDEKYLNLLDENSALLMNRREQEQIIDAIRQELIQTKINHHRAINKLKSEHANLLCNYKKSYSRAIEEQNDIHEYDLACFRREVLKQKQTISELKRNCLSTEQDLSSAQNEIKELKGQLNSSETSITIAVTTLVIFVGICLYRYFN